MENDLFINTTYVALKFPIIRRQHGFLGTVSVEAPYLYYSLSDPDLQVGGLGDLKFHATFTAVVFRSIRASLIVGSQFFIPSAADAILKPFRIQMTSLLVIWELANSD